ncbi:MAG: sigma-54-dependent Fis family transcriptional regulator [Firmicutes bacterium]|nr:sigma-54-dependent Fis family transcriptional regulator [Bacillota bacterium]
MKILLVDDDKKSRQATSRFLKELGHQVTECDSGECALKEYAEQDYPLVLTDIKMPGMSGLELLERISRSPHRWKTDVVLFTGFGDMQSVMEALRAGAYDYILKPVDAEMLAALIERIAEHQALRRENQRLTEHFDEELEAATQDTQRELMSLKKAVAKNVGVGPVGVFSEVMESIVERARMYHRDRGIPVLIEGETGTGKEIMARLVHYGEFERTASLAEPFVDVNCAAINPNLFESEIFGYEAGAFTSGSPRGQRGKLDLAVGGTLFLDEISELPPEVQAKLLRVIQEREYYRVGGLKKIKTDVRIVCATNTRIEEEVERGGFRRDLYYRLKVGQIQIPPLRERREEIVKLAEMFLREFSGLRKRWFQSIGAEAAGILTGYGWPGNVRELRNVMEMVVFLFDDVEVRRQHLEGLLAENGKAGGEDDPKAVSSLILPFPAEGYSLKDYNNLIIQKVLEAHGGNHTATARYLGISRRALLYRLEENGIKFN